MWYAVPVKDLLLLLCPYAVILIHKVQERTFGFFKRCIGTRFQISQIREYTLLELFRIFYGATEGLEAKREAAHNICTRDVKKIIPINRQHGQLEEVVVRRNLCSPQDTRHVFACGQEESSYILVGRPIDRGRYEEIFHYRRDVNQTCHDRNPHEDARNQSLIGWLGWRAWAIHLQLSTCCNAT